MITRNYPNGMILALGAAVLSLAVGTPAWIRVVPVLLVLVAMPGVTLARHIGHDGARTPVALTVAIGMAWLVVASEALLYARWWKPAALIPATLAVSAIAVVVPARRAAHRVRLLRRPLVAVISLAGTFVALQIWAMFRAPYGREELAALQGALTWSPSTTGRTGGVRLSALSLVESLVIPLRRPSTGTLLAARWLGLGLLIAAVVAAATWARMIVNRRAAATTAVLLTGAAAVVHVDGMSGVAAVGAPLLLAAGWCLTDTERRPRRMALGGALLGAGALCSRQCALAAVGLLLWAVVDARQRQRRRASADPDGPTLPPSVVLGMLAAVAVGALVASGAGVTVPVLSGAMPRDVGGGGPHTVAILLASLPILLLALAALARALPSLAKPSHRGVVNVSHAPMFALAGALAGASIESASLARVALLPLLLMALCAGTLIGAELGDHDDVTGLPRRSVLLRVGVAAVIAAPLGVTVVRTWHSTNHAQLARVASVLAGSPAEVVFDPVGPVAVLRPRVGPSAAVRSARGRAIFHSRCAG